MSAIPDLRLSTEVSDALERRRPVVALESTIIAHGLPRLAGVGGEGPEVEVRVDPDLFRRVLRDLWEAGSLRPTPRSLCLEVRTVSPWVEFRVVRSADPIDTGLNHKIGPSPEPAASAQRSLPKWGMR